MSDEPVVAQKGPFQVALEKGRSYAWCTCGRSGKQPFCDGSHKGSSFSPLKYTAPETKKAFFCTCKQTANAPLCNGAHKTLA